jgi:RNA recognition motif-containing protein
MAAVKLFVGGLSWDTTDDSLKDLFAKAGTVISANVIKDKYTGRSRGFGFVEMSSDKEAEEAKKLNGQPLDGRNISVNDARPQASREEGGAPTPAAPAPEAEKPEEPEEEVKEESKEEPKEE